MLARQLRSGRLAPMPWACRTRCSSSSGAPPRPQCRSSSSSSSSAAELEQQLLPPHASVLLQEVLDSLSHMPIKVFVDCTLGAGGHTAGMIQRHPELEVCAGIDVDPTAHAIAAARLAPLLQQRSGSAPALHQLHGNYSEVASLLGSCPGGSLVGRVDAALMDLGCSSMQFDSAERGFSFAADGPIDMRMDQSSDAPSAYELVNAASEAQLGAILREFGEEKAWRNVARRIVAARERAPLTSTRQLADVIGHTLLPGSGSGGRQQRRSGGGSGGRGIHPATRTFQALRIAVNEELQRLTRALPVALSCLAPGGRLAVISFHSLEDRLVKRAFARAAGRPTPEQEALLHGPDGCRLLDELAASAQGSVVTRKPIVPSAAEVAANPRSRSAKLRVFQRAGGPPEDAGGDGWRRRRSSGAASLPKRRRGAAAGGGDVAEAPE